MRCSSCGKPWRLYEYGKVDYMKKVTAIAAAMLLLVLSMLPAAFATDVEVENASRPAIELACEDVGEDEILRVQVSLSGCAGLTDADLRFTYDPEVLTYLGGSLQGAAASDESVIATFSDSEHAAQNGWVSVSVFHLDSFTVQEGNGLFCELAFRTSQGRSTIRAEAVSFRILEESATPSLGKCSYSSGLASFFRENGSALFVAAVIAVVVLVLIVLLVVIRRTKKTLPAQPETFDVNEPSAEDAAAAVPDSAPAEEAEAATDDISTDTPAQPNDAGADADAADGQNSDDSADAVDGEKEE